jgi:hypothetical protein
VASDVSLVLVSRCLCIRSKLGTKGTVSVVKCSGDGSRCAKAQSTRVTGEVLNYGCQNMFLACSWAAIMSTR